MKTKNKNQVLCPDCEKKVKLISDTNTDWYGNLKYYRCSNCKETFVSRDNGMVSLKIKCGNARNNLNLGY